MAGGDPSAGRHRRGVAGRRYRWLFAAGVAPADIVRDPREDPRAPFGDWPIPTVRVVRSVARQSGDLLELIADNVPIVMGDGEEGGPASAWLFPRALMVSHVQRRAHDFLGRILPFAWVARPEPPGLSAWNRAIELGLVDAGLHRGFACLLKGFLTVLCGWGWCPQWWVDEHGELRDYRYVQGRGTYPERWPRLVYQNHPAIDLFVLHSLSAALGQLRAELGRRDEEARAPRSVYPLHGEGPPPEEGSRYSASVPLVLEGPGRAPVIFGRPAGKLTPKQYKVVKALQDAGPEGLPKSRLVRESGVGDARGILTRLRKDPAWGRVIIMSGAGREGYRLQFSAEQLAEYARSPAEAGDPAPGVA